MYQSPYSRRDPRQQQQWAQFQAYQQQQQQKMVQLLKLLTLSPALATAKANATAVASALNGIAAFGPTGNNADAVAGVVNQLRTQAQAAANNEAAVFSAEQQAQTLDLLFGGALGGFGGGFGGGIDLSQILLFKALSGGGVSLF